MDRLPPCFDWIAENGVQQEVMVFLTDLWGTLPNEISQLRSSGRQLERKKAPFCRVVPTQGAGCTLTISADTVEMLSDLEEATTSQKWRW